MTFTEHFRRLDRGSPIDTQLLDDLCDALRRRLRRAGLWDTPPSYLGYEGGTWQAILAQGGLADAVVDCYLEAVVRRYDSLRDHLDKKGNIDGLILLNIDRFILARQKLYDPVGYSVFKNLEAVLESLDEAGIAIIDQRVGGKVRNATTVRFTAGAPLAPPDELEGCLKDQPAWEHAFPRLVKIGQGAQRLLRGCVEALPGAGAFGFVVGDLARTLKARTGAAHARRVRPADHEVARAEGVDKGLGELIRIVRTDGGYSEAKESFSALSGRLRAVILAQNDLQERTRAGMLRLVEELLHYADSDEEVPGWAELARSLGARRTTLWDHVERLRALTERLTGR